MSSERFIVIVPTYNEMENLPRKVPKILAQDERVLDDPEPMVKLHELGDSSVNFVVRPWVATDDYWDVWWDTTRAVKMRFDEEGITIPFPQTDVHFHAAAPPADPRA